MLLDGGDLLDGSLGEEAPFFVQDRHHLLANIGRKLLQGEVTGFEKSTDFQFDLLRSLLTVEYGHINLILAPP